MRLNRIEIRDFKRISSISIDLEDVTLLVGGNNSGKSSVLQAIHFAVASLRAAKQHGKSASQPATTLATNQFNYRPSNDLMGLRYRSPMTQQSGPNITFHFEDADGDTKKYSLSLYRGKNANIQLLYASGTPFFKAASSLTKPFSIFVPGLAGLSLQEELRSNSIINSGIAQGDANLYLRNVLHRLCNDSTKLSRFHSMIDPIFFQGFEFRRHSMRILISS